MLNDHYAFILITTFFLLLITGLTITGLSIIDVESDSESVIMFCEPLTCAERGLQPAGRFYCDINRCYRDCYQNDLLIEKATFCEKYI